MPAAFKFDTSALTFQIYEGQLQPIQAIPDFYRRLGVDGEGSQELGRIGPDCQIKAHYLTTSRGDAQSARFTASGWLGKYGRVTEPDSGVWTSVLVKSSVTSIKRGAYAYAGGLYAYRMTCEMVLATQQ